MQDPTPVRLSELARILRLRESFLRAEADSGRIPFLQAGLVRLFDPNAVRRVLAERAAAGEGDLGTPPNQEVSDG